MLVQTCVKLRIGTGPDNANECIRRWKPSTGTESATAGLPLVSVVIATYNNRHQTLQAIQSLFNQDYPNLEIVITDDASSDDVFEAITAECESYAKERGIHSIVLNHNLSNLGICKNYEKGVMLSRGEIIAIQGGDDIAHPDRISSIVSHWIKDGRKATVIFHGLRPVDMNGRPLDYEWWPLTVRNPLGAAMAYTSVIKTEFSPIEFNEAFEDNVFVRRAYLFGDPLYIDEKLIDYRIGSGFTSSGSAISTRIKISNAMVQTTLQNRLDLERVKNVIDPERYRYISDLVNEIADTYGREYRLYTAKGLREIIPAFRNAPTDMARDYLIRKLPLVHRLARAIKRAVRR